MPTFEAVRRDHTFVDLQGVTIHWYSWMPGAPKALVLLVHGVGEHALRYDELVQRLVQRGYGVAALDQRGHGATGLQQWHGDVRRLGRLGAGGMDAVVGDVVGLLKRLRGAHPGLPITVMGHSWGSLTLQLLLNRYAPLVDAAVLSGTAYRMPGSMNGGDLNARHRHLGTTGFEWLSRDVAVQEAFAADPLTFEAQVLRLFGPVEAAKLLGVPGRSLGADVPILIMVGSDDALGGEASATKLAQAYERRSGLTDVTVRVYPGARHEIFHEITRSKTLDDLTTWLDARMPEHPPAQAPAAVDVE